MALVTNKYTHQFLPDLIKLLDHPDGIVRDQAADVISHIVGPGDQAIIPVLTNAIIARKCVTYAVESLGRIGPGARMAIPTIAPLLAHNSSLKRSVTAFALLQMGTENSPKSREIESVVAANVGSLYLPDIHLDLPLTIVLRAAITNSSPTLAHFSAIVLNVGNHHLPDVLSRLRSSLTNADPNLRITAAYSLVSAGIDDDAILQQVPEAAVDLLLSRARRKDFEAQ